MKARLDHDPRHAAPPHGRLDLALDADERRGPREAGADRHVDKATDASPREASTSALCPSRSTVLRLSPGAGAPRRWPWRRRGHAPEGTSSSGRPGGPRWSSTPRRRSRSSREIRDGRVRARGARTRTDGGKSRYPGARWLRRPEWDAFLKNPPRGVPKGSLGRPMRGERWPNIYGYGDSAGLYAWIEPERLVTRYAMFRSG